MEKHQAEGYRDLEGKFIVPKLLEHWHEELEINCIFDGQCEYLVNGQRTLIQENEMMIINSEHIHSVTIDYSSIHKKDFAIALLLDFDFVSTVLPDLKESIFLNEYIQRNSQCLVIMKKMYQCYCEEENQYKNIKMIGLVYELLYEICCSGAKHRKDIVSVNSQKNIERLRGIMQYVAEHYRENLAQEKVAKRFYFSNGYFAQFFKKYTGITFKEYVDRYRLIQAMDLLKDDSKSMTDIAMAVGFADTRRFILNCKKYYGNTPYQIKLQQLKKENNH